MAAVETGARLRAIRAIDEPPRTRPNARLYRVRVTLGSEKFCYSLTAPDITVAAALVDHWRRVHVWSVAT